MGARRSCGQLSSIMGSDKVIPMAVFQEVFPIQKNFQGILTKTDFCIIIHHASMIVIREMNKETTVFLWALYGNMISEN